MQVYQINERCLILLSQRAAGAETWQSPAIVQNRKLWMSLTPEVIRCCARLPFVIVDMRFVDELWWRAVASSVRPGIDDEPIAACEWSAKFAEPLSAETLIFAWHTAKSDRRVARLVLGMVPAVTEIVAALTPQQLAAISVRHHSALRLRWQDDPKFWARLVRAAADPDPGGLSVIHLHAKLLLCGQLLSHTLP